ncbi:hypothetical protein CPB84DRAFT_1684572, partial [Gymnopilus junonius]
DPIPFRCCHCQNCKKRRVLLMTNTFLRKIRIYLHSLRLGFQKICITEGEEMLTIYPDQATWNGATLNRYFCSHCGSNVFLKSTDKAAIQHGILIIALGTLDDEVDWVPRTELWPELRRHFVHGIETKKKAKL